MPAAFGVIITVNANGDSCDTYMNLFMDPLFVDPGNLNFHLTEYSPCIDAGDTDPLYFDPDGTVADMGAFYFDQSQIPQQISLSSGFSFVSSRISPDNPDMMEVATEIINDDLQYIRNSTGAMLRKIGPNWVNGIGDWIGVEGYLIKTNIAGQFTIEGTLIPQGTPIELLAGFQFASYLPNEEMDASEAFASIIGENLLYVRNSTGAMLRKIGPNWVNGIGYCQHSEGYLVKMFSDDTLVYPASFSCGDPYTDHRDDQIYNTIQIGEQCWMAKNLNIGEMINSTEIMINNGVIEKYCYDNDPDNCEEYGGLYQWDEMMQYVNDSATQGICPEGWYLPTDYEWKILEGTVDSQYPVGDTIWNNLQYRGYDAGKNLKSTSGWYSYGNGTDLYGFTALPGGFRISELNFAFLTKAAKFWSSSEIYNDYSWLRSIWFAVDKISRLNHNKGNSNSVRCLKDNPIFDNLSIVAKGQANDLSDPKKKSNEPIHFVFKGGNPAEAVYTIYAKGFSIGDEIGVYNGGILAGSGVVVSDNILENAIPVFSNLYEAGNKPTIKVWDKSENKEYILSDYIFSNPYGDAWTEDVFPVEDGEYSLMHFSTTGISDENMINNISIYPNPSKGIFNISLEGIEGNIQIKVLDLRGKGISNFELSEAVSTKLDLTELVAGVYFISFSGKDFSDVKKIVIK